MNWGKQDVADGSLADFRCRPRDVRFTPNSGHRADRRDVRFVPIADIARANASYSITSSAMASSDGGTAMPSILAVWALMTKSNLDACTTGRSAGLAPLRMRPV